MKYQKLIICISFIGILSCSKKEGKLFTVKNTLDMEREFETVELTKDLLKLEDLSNLGIRSLATGELEITQLVDKDNDGIADVILFQPTIKANSEKEYTTVVILEEKRQENENWCYSRFVPERTDDYAWENNKVAFRTFGPTAQKMVEDGVVGGTLSSGIDAWLKKVDYPIIDAWYKKELETDGSYHEDTGEGLDNFHVGRSRGVGGTAVKIDTTYYSSKNFNTWQTITNGPIRTSFKLDYLDWDANGKNIKESKTISLDYGHNLSKFEIEIDGDVLISAGLTLHEKDGVTTTDNTSWVSYWQPHGNSELGSALVTTDLYFNGFEEYATTEKDLSNAYMHLNVIDGKTIYYAGFGWKESGQFVTKETWESYLKTFAKKIQHPLEVKLISE